MSTAVRAKVIVEIVYYTSVRMYWARFEESKGIVDICDRYESITLFTKCVVMVRSDPPILCSARMKLQQFRILRSCFT